MHLESSKDVAWYKVQVTGYRPLRQPGDAPGELEGRGMVQGTGYRVQASQAPGELEGRGMRLEVDLLQRNLARDDACRVVHLDSAVELHLDELLVAQAEHLRVGTGYRVQGTGYLVQGDELLVALAEPLRQRQRIASMMGRWARALLTTPSRYLTVQSKRIPHSLKQADTSQSKASGYLTV